MKSIIISGMPASGKTTLAEILARKLKMQAIGASDILKEMAKDRGYRITGADWWDTREAMKFVKERQANPNFDKETDRRMMERIRKGNVVVTSYTMPWLSRNGFKIWLKASMESRARRMAERDKTTIWISKIALRKRDKENVKLYKKLYKVRFGKDLSPFDMIIDTNGLTSEQVARKVLTRIKKLKL